MLRARSERSPAGLASRCRSRPTPDVEATRRAATSAKSQTVSWNVFVLVEFLIVLRPGVKNWSDAHCCSCKPFARRNGMVERFQTQVSEYKTAEPAEDHALSLRRASSTRGTHGRNWGLRHCLQTPIQILAVSRPKPVWMGFRGPSIPIQGPIQSPSQSRLDGQSSGLDDGRGAPRAE